MSAVWGVFTESTIVHRELPGVFRLLGMPHRGHPSTAKASYKRTGYNLVVPITIPDRRELEERARKELRSLSGYVAKLIVEDLSK